MGRSSGAGVGLVSSVFGRTGAVAATAGDYAAADVTNAMVDPGDLPKLIDVSPFVTPIAQTNWTTNIVDTASLYCGYTQSSGAQNDSVSYDVLLAAGTWTVEMLTLKGTAEGIMSVQFDDVEQGTVDLYNGSTSRNVLLSVTGIVVAATALIRVKFKMATKNASASNYYGHLMHVQFRRTA